MEEQVSTGFIQWEVTEFIEDEQLRFSKLFEFEFEQPLHIGGGEVIDGADGGGEQDAVAFEACLIADGTGEMGFPKSDAAHEDDVFIFVDEGEPEEMLNEGLIDFMWPRPLELFQGFDLREARLLDSQLSGAVEFSEHLRMDEFSQEVQMRPLFLGGGGGELLEVVGAIVEFELNEIIF